MIHESSRTPPPQPWKPSYDDGSDASTCATLGEDDSVSVGSSTHLGLGEGSAEPNKTVLVPEKNEKAPTRATSLGSSEIASRIRKIERHFQHPPEPPCKSTGQLTKKKKASTEDDEWNVSHRQHRELEDTLCELKLELAELRAREDSFQFLNQALGDERDLLKMASVELVTEIDELKASANKSSTEVNKLQLQMSKMEADIERLNAVNKDLNNDKDQLQRTIQLLLSKSSKSSGQRVSTGHAKGAQDVHTKGAPVGQKGKRQPWLARRRSGPRNARQVRPIQCIADESDYI